MKRVVESPLDCDYYAELEVIREGPVELPPENVAMLPTMYCDILEDEAADDKAWYQGAMEATCDLVEKGFIPVFAGGDGKATLPVVEAIHRMTDKEEVVLIHFSSTPHLEPTDPIRVLLEKQLLKGVVSIGNRCVSTSDRKVRRTFKTHYLDAHALFSKGISTVRDIRNDFPVYLSVNMDVVDPAFAPGVRSPQSGGFSVRELLHLIHGIRGAKLMGADVHGYVPSCDLHSGGDGVGTTELAAAKVIKEVIFKAYTTSVQTYEEGLSRVSVMKREGTLSDDPYPTH